MVGMIEVEKVMGIINRADALTKRKEGSSLKQHSHWTSQDISKGRHEFAPKFTNAHHSNCRYGDDTEEE